MDEIDKDDKENEGEKEKADYRKTSINQYMKIFKKFTDHLEMTHVKINKGEHIDCKIFNTFINTNNNLNVIPHKYITVVYHHFTFTFQMLQIIKKFQKKRKWKWKYKYFAPCIQT